VPAAVLVGTALCSGTAMAAWAVTGTGAAPVAAATLRAPSSPKVQATGGSVTVSWDSASSGGTAATGYVVRRYAGGNGVSGTGTVICDTGPGVSSCVDPAPTATTSSYVVSARRSAWESAAPSVSISADTSAPLSTATTSPTANSRGWITASPVTVTLTATDGPAGGSGVATIGYRVDGGTVTSAPGATTTLTVPKQGTITIDYWATDLAGNVEATKSLQLRIDSSAPAAPAALRISDDSGASSTDMVTNGVQQTVSGSAEAGGSVEAYYQGSLAGSGTVDADGTFRIGPLTMPPGSRPMLVRSIDPAGNVSADLPFTVLVDTTAPVPAVTFPAASGSYTSTTWPKGCAAAGLCGTASDTGSGLTAVLYELRNTSSNTCWNGSGFTAGACTPLRPTTGTASWSVPVSYTPLPKSVNLKLSVYADDLAGNRSTLLTRTFQVR